MGSGRCEQARYSHPVQPTGVMSCVTGFRTSEGSETTHIGQKVMLRILRRTLSTCIVLQWTYLNDESRLAGHTTAYVLTVIWRLYKQLVKMLKFESQGKLPLQVAKICSNSKSIR
jgi:hypothetical protein